MAEPTLKRSSESRIVAALELPLPLDSLGARFAKLTAEFGEGLSSRQKGQCLEVFTPADFYPIECWCARCVDETRERFFELTGRHLSRFMILCPTCGNKRCPHASYHSNECSRSNEPGQEGSVYA